MKDTKNSFLLVGKIVSLHGLKGTVKVYSYTDEPLSIFKPDVLIVARNTKGMEETYVIEWVKLHKLLTLLVSLQGIGCCNQAETLINSELFIEKSKLPRLEDETCYWFDIIGLSVFTTDEKYLGCVESIIQTGSNDVYVVKDPDKGKDGEVLIPALKSVVLSIDLKRKIMRVDLPEGL